MCGTKVCLGKWNDCPESTTKSFCKKVRNCIIEIPCMREWLKLNNKNN
jgi:hypothetical protein